MNYFALAVLWFNLGHSAPLESPSLVLSNSYKVKTELPTYQALLFKEHDLLYTIIDFTKQYFKKTNKPQLIIRLLKYFTI